MTVNTVGVSFDGNRHRQRRLQPWVAHNFAPTSFEGFSITSVESIEIYRTTSPD